MYNFISTFDELNKLYEEAPKVVTKKVDDLCTVMLDKQSVFTGTKQECNDFVKKHSNTEVAKYKKFEIVQGAEVPVIEEACSKKKLTEDEEIEIVDDEAAVEEIPAEEPVAEDEPRQVICECDKCGALVIVDEADIKVDDETDLVNVDEECKFCEETTGYKIIGTLAPYEAVEEPVDEAPVEEPAEELAEEDPIEEDLADVARKVFDKPASIATQQRWEDELNDDSISPARRQHLMKKFAQQRDWEEKHPDKEVK